MKKKILIVPILSMASSCYSMEEVYPPVSPSVANNWLHHEAPKKFSELTITPLEGLNGKQKIYNPEAIKVIKDKILELSQYKQSIVDLYKLYPDERAEESKKDKYVLTYEAWIKELNTLLFKPMALKDVIQKINEIDREYHPEDDL